MKSEIIATANDETLQLIALCIGGEIEKRTAPLIGNYIIVRRSDGNVIRRVADEPKIPSPIDVSYEWDDLGELVRINIGSRYHGPMIGWYRNATADGSAGWSNRYSNGNYGGNCAHGGTWSADSKRVYPTIAAAIADRDYVVCGLTHERAKYTETAAILDLLKGLEG